MNSKKLTLAMLFLILALLILQSCSRVAACEPESEEPSLISCSHVVLSSGTEESLQIVEYKLVSVESNLDTYESCYLQYCVSVDSIAITDSEINAIESIELNIADSMLAINGNEYISAKNKRISYLKN